MLVSRLCAHGHLRIHSGNSGSRGQSGRSLFLRTPDRAERGEAHLHHPEQEKELVFTIEPQRCDITVDGSMAERNLKFAHIGDAVIGEVSLKEAKPYVSWVEFTHKPQVGKAVPGRPGYILSPYLPKWPEPWHHAEAMDARQLAHGDMVLDDLTGKIFLVP